MANTSSAKKAARVSARRAAVNQSRRSRIRTFYKKVEEALTAGDKKAATVALQQADAEAQRGVTKNILKKKTVARKISRLAARVKKLA